MIKIFDGGFGSQLISKNICFECPEELNLTQGEVIKQIHKEYADNGADIITTNTFGANPLKLKSYDLEDKVIEINVAGINLAKTTGKEIAFSVGPTGEFVKPVGDVSFEEMYEIFYRQLEAITISQPDYVIFETFSDIAELRAGIIALKDIFKKHNIKIPILASMTYDSIYTLTGVSPAAQGVILDALGVDAIGINCSKGPKDILELLVEIEKYTSVKLIAQPNAGMPEIVGEDVVYSMSASEFANQMKPYFELNMGYIGSCCGSTPEFTKELRRLADSIEVKNIKENKASSHGYLASKGKVVSSEAFILIGEAINPHARKAVKQYMEEFDIKGLTSVISEQCLKGADVIDINVNAEGADKKALARELVISGQLNSDFVLCIDSKEPEIIEEALKNYAGKALINSVALDEKELSEILPLAKKYGASVIGLCIENEILPTTIAETVEIAEKLKSRLLSEGIKAEDIYIDPLLFTNKTYSISPLDTVEIVRQLSNKGIKTSLGLSNVSYGMKNRDRLNQTLLSMLIGSGLSMAIASASSKGIVETIESAQILMGKEKLSNKTYIELEDIDKLTIEGELIYQLINKEEPSAFDSLLAEKTEQEVINTMLIALDKAGKLYDEKIIFLPDMMQVVEKVQGLFDRLENKAKSSHTLVFGTVYGDIHDIGKNIVKSVLKPFGYNIIDLGKSVTKEAFAAKAKEVNADIIGISALMTTTMVNLEPTIEYIKSELPNVKIIVGGAVVTEDYARKVGADGYSKDAIKAIGLVKSLTEVDEK